MTGNFTANSPPPRRWRQSRNLPAMYVLSRVGVSRCVEIHGRDGISNRWRARPIDIGLPLAIGGAEATPMELAEAYATLARGGLHRPVSEIVGSDQRAPFHEASSDSINTPDSANASSVLLRDACFATLGEIADPDRTSRFAARRRATTSHGRPARAAAIATRGACGHASRDGGRMVRQRRRTGIGGAGRRGCGRPAALALIAALDPVDDPWPETHLRESPARPIPPTQFIAIAWPADGAEIIVTGEQPHAVEFRTAGENHPAWWFVDGSPLGAGARIDWPPVLGWHEIRLLDDAGHSATVRVRIR